MSDNKQCIQITALVPTAKNHFITTLKRVYITQSITIHTSFLLDQLFLVIHTPNKNILQITSLVYFVQAMSKISLSDFNNGIVLLNRRKTGKGSVPSSKEHEEPFSFLFYSNQDLTHNQQIMLVRCSPKGTGVEDVFKWLCTHYMN